jgi:hypothetical protein
MLQSYRSSWLHSYQAAHPAAYFLSHWEVIKTDLKISRVNCKR